MQVYVAMANMEGRVECLGVFKDKTGAMNLCSRQAEEYAEHLYPEDYEYEKVYYDKNGAYVDTFSWTVFETNIH